MFGRRLGCLPEMGWHGIECGGYGWAPEQPDDLVVVGSEAVWLSGERIESRATHGTGCAFSSALLSRLVLGDAGMDAARRAKQYVTEAIRTAEAVGEGFGPVNHLWPLHKE